MSAFIDLTGKRFGFLTVIKRSEQKGKDGHVWWDCLCDCGKEKAIDGGSLRHGQTKSCGCYFIKCVSKNNHKKTITNKHHHALYSKWLGMKKRCYNPENPSYKYYGGKGLTVSDDWLSFENFYFDMVDLYKEGLTIERIDNTIGYCKDNCKWIPMEEQPRNTSQNVIVEFDGESYILSDLSRKYNIPYSALRTRLLRGWRVEDAIFTTVSQRKSERYKNVY